MTEVLMGIVAILFTFLLWDVVQEAIEEDEEDAKHFAD